MLGGFRESASTSEAAAGAQRGDNPCEARAFWRQPPSGSGAGREQRPPRLGQRH